MWVLPALIQTTAIRRDRTLRLHPMEVEQRTTVQPATVDRRQQRHHHYHHLRHRSVRLLPALLNRLAAKGAAVAADGRLFWVPWQLLHTVANLRYNHGAAAIPLPEIIYA